MKIDARDIHPHHDDHKLRRRLAETGWVLLLAALIAFALQYFQVSAAIYHEALTWLAIGLCALGATLLAAAGILLEVHKLRIMWRDSHMR